MTKNEHSAIERQAPGRQPAARPVAPVAALYATPAVPAAAHRRLRQAPLSEIRPADILALQRTAGNQAVRRLLAQRGVEGAAARQQPSRPQVGAEGGAVPPPLEAALERARGGGQPLPAEARRPAEMVLGADFGAVRVHADASSDKLNRALQSRAFTHGRDIFFRQGAYEPGSRAGERLLAHELAHVGQQDGGTAQRDWIRRELDYIKGRVSGESWQGKWYDWRDDAAELLWGTIKSAEKALQDALAQVVGEDNGRPTKEELATAARCKDELSKLPNPVPYSKGKQVKDAVERLRDAAQGLVETKKSRVRAEKEAQERRERERLEEERRQQQLREEAERQEQKRQRKLAHEERMRQQQAARQMRLRQRAEARQQRREEFRKKYPQKKGPSPEAVEEERRQQEWQAEREAGAVRHEMRALAESPRILEMREVGMPQWQRVAELQAEVESQLKPGVTAAVGVRQSLANKVGALQKESVQWDDDLGEVVALLLKVPAGVLRDAARSYLLDLAPQERGAHGGLLLRYVAHADLALAELRKARQSGAPDSLAQAEAALEVLQQYDFQPALRDRAEGLIAQETDRALQEEIDRLNKIEAEYLKANPELTRKQAGGAKERDERKRQRVEKTKETKRGQERARQEAGRAQQAHRAVVAAFLRRHGFSPAAEAISSWGVAGIGSDTAALKKRLDSASLVMGLIASVERIKEVTEFVQSAGYSDPQIVALTSQVAAAPDDWTKIKQFASTHDKERDLALATLRSAQALKVRLDDVVQLIADGNDLSRVHYALGRAAKVKYPPSYPQTKARSTPLGNVQTILRLLQMAGVSESNLDELLASESRPQKLEKYMGGAGLSAEQKKPARFKTLLSKVTKDDQGTIVPDYEKIKELAAKDPDMNTQALLNLDVAPQKLIDALDVDTTKLTAARLKNIAAEVADKVAAEALLKFTVDNKPAIVKLLVERGRDAKVVKKMKDANFSATQVKRLARFEHDSKLPADLAGDDRLNPYADASMAHFAVRHTYRHFAFTGANIGNKGATMWAKGTTAADLEARLLAAIPTMALYKVKPNGFRKFTGSANGTAVELGVMGTAITQFFPRAGDSFTNQELRSFQNVLGS